MYDGNEYDSNGNIINKEQLTNGVLNGMLVGGLGTASYGLNNNHKIITPDNTVHINSMASKSRYFS